MFIVGAITFAASTALGQTDEERAGARSMAQQGAEAYAEERWQDAVDLFTRAQSLVDAPPHLLYIARAQEKLGKLVEAQEAYIKVTRAQLSSDAPQAFLSAQAEAIEELEALKPRVPQVTVVVKGADATNAEVEVDGSALPEAFIGVKRPTNPGERVYAATSPSSEVASVTINLAEGAVETVTLELITSTALPPADEPAPLPIVAPAAAPVEEDAGGSSYTIPMYAAFGVGGAGVIAGTVFVIQRSTKQSDADAHWDDCLSDRGCNDSDVAEIDALDSDAARAGTLSLIGYGIGVAGLGAGVALWLLDNAEPQSATRSAEPSVMPWVGADQVGLLGHF